MNKTIKLNYTLIILAILTAGCVTYDKSQSISNSIIKSNKDSLIVFGLLKTDSVKNTKNVRNYYGIFNDIVYSNKEYPPKGSKYDENMGLNNNNENFESGLIKTIIRSCISIDRVLDLAQSNRSVMLLFYTDKQGVIKEVVFITSNNKKLFLTTNESLNIISKFRGVKLTIPNAFIDYEYFQYYYVINLKSLINTPVARSLPKQ